MTWNYEPKDFALDIKSDLAEVRNKAALFGLRTLMLRTPVDTGRARGGWSVGINRIEATDRGAGSQNAALSEGAAKIASTKDQPYVTLYLTNTIPYIQYLNDGTSKIRPMRFLETTFNDIRVRFG